MADNDATMLPPPSPEHRRIAASQFERANQVIATGNYDYGIRLLMSCCKLDAANLIYRQALRRTEKTKYRNNLRGSWLASVTTIPVRARLKAAKSGRDWLRVLEFGEAVLAHNPWDTGAQMDMAEAADALGLLDLAIWTLEQARQKNPREAALNRSLARLYEKRGNFTQAIALWELVRKAAPGDVEAQGKAKDLAASETIARGNYAGAVGGGASGLRPDSEADLPAAPPEAGAAPSPGSSAPLPTVKGQTPPPPNRHGGEVARLRGRIETDPTNANAHLQLATHFRRLGQIDQAREVLQQGLGPTGFDFQLALEMTDLEIEPFRRNLTVAEEKLRTHPNDEELRRIRIRLLKEINTREMDLFRQKADRFPTEMAHRFELGIRLLRAGQVDEAIRELQASRADPRHFARSLLYLGHCFKARNNWKLAKRNFEEALQHLPPNEEAVRKEVLFLLAQGSAEAGDLAAAVDLGLELANLDFAYRDIGKLLDEWQDRLQQADVSPG